MRRKSGGEFLSLEMIHRSRVLRQSKSVAHCAPFKEFPRFRSPCPRHKILFNGLNVRGCNSEIWKTVSSRFIEDRNWRAQSTLATVDGNRETNLKFKKFRGPRNKENEDEELSATTEWKTGYVEDPPTPFASDTLSVNPEDYQ